MYIITCSFDSFENLIFDLVDVLYFFSLLISKSSFLTLKVLIPIRIRKEERYIFWTWDYCRGSDVDEILGL
ncbi:MAG: hypothetical protein CL916_10725 [Deltaproteobacteria bacterium]|nr:hypothetical protein [Deltaproteobacteria bacterium]